MSAAAIALGAAPVAAAGAWMLDATREVKLSEHGVRVATSAVDACSLAAAAAVLSGAVAGGHAVAAAAIGLGLVVLFAGLWLDAVLFRVYSIELGLEGVRQVVLPLLARELTEVAFARRFFRERRAFVAAPAVLAAAFVAPFCAPLVAPVLAAAMVAAAPRVRLAPWALAYAPLALGPELAGSHAAAVALASAAVVAAAALRVRPAPSALRAFLLPRRAEPSRSFVPAADDGAAIELPLRPASRSGAHGLLAGSNVVLWTFESMGRDHLRAHGGRAATPFLESLGRGGTCSDHHFAPCALTNDAHVALYTGDYVAARGFGLLEALGAAGYRRLYLTTQRTAHYGLADLLRAAGFDRVVDRETLGGGAVGDSLLPTRGLDSLQDELRRGPFFLHVHTANTHVPYRIEDAATFSRFDAADDYGRYLDSLEEADAILRAAFESVLRRVEPRETARETARETLWVVSADHGQAFGELGYRSHGSAVVKEQVNVPLVVHHPRLPPRRLRWSSHLDVLPTVLDLVGVESLHPCRGDTLFGAPRDPLLVLSAGSPARSTSSNRGLVIGERKYMVDLVLDRCLRLSWSDEGSELQGAERTYAHDLVAHAFARAGLR